MKNILWPAILAGVIATGCSHVAKRRDRIQSKLDEHSRVLTTAVVDTLQSQPVKDDYSLLAFDLAREDQRIEGLPAESLPVREWVGQTNMANRFEEIHRLLEQRRTLEERLVDYGARWEEQRNARHAQWAKRTGSAAIVLCGAIALCFFFPAAIPILGHLLAWLVAKNPSLASVAGVVSVKAFDAVVRGLEKSRGDGRAILHNGPAPLTMDLESRLSREMDADHKALVRARKAALNL